jgi:hypothetical protein
LAFRLWSAAIYRRFCFSLFVFFGAPQRVKPALSLCAGKGKEKRKTKAAINRRTPK